MAFNKEEFIASIESMTVLELSELVKALEDRFGVTAAAPVAVAAAGPAGPAAVAEEQKRIAEAEKESESIRGTLRWALIVVGGIAALAVAAGASWWFFLRRR